MGQKPQRSGARPGEPGGGLAIDLAQPLTDAGAGLPAFRARHPGAGPDGAMALMVRRQEPPRPRPLVTLPGTVIPGLLTLHGHGLAPGPQGVPELFVTCDSPPGPAVGTSGAISRRWGEAELVACVMRPIGATLLALQRLRLSHRAIRPDNVFQARPDYPVVLGIGWAAPPAALQPASCEPADVAACLPGGRGDGSHADDVYALGVLLLALAAGRLPLGELTPTEIVRRKRAAGSFAALVADLSITQGVAELVRGMLSDDPEHRPAPAQLQVAEAVRGRRLAIRPARVAARPFDVAGHLVWHGRALAGVLAEAPEQAADALRAGAVERWVRRDLGESTLAARIDAVARGATPEAESAPASDALRVMRTVALLDPLAPLCWRGLALWPDGLGPALAAATPAQLQELATMVRCEAVAAWAEARPERCDVAMLRAQARDWRILVSGREWAGGIGVLSAQLNPLLRCPSPILDGHPVVRGTDLLPALEGVAHRPAGRPALPIDQQIAAYVAGHDDLRLGREAAALTAGLDAPAALAQLRLLARLQARSRAAPTPALAGWFAEALRPLLGKWRGVVRRSRTAAALERQAETGLLANLLMVIDDPTERDADAAEAEAARAAILRIDEELAAIASARDIRAARATSAALAISLALATMALSVVAAALAL